MKTTLLVLLAASLFAPSAFGQIAERELADRTALARQLSDEFMSRTARIKATLKLTPEQAKSWSDFEVILVDIGRTRAERVIALRASRRKRPVDAVEQIRTEFGLHAGTRRRTEEACGCGRAPACEAERSAAAPLQRAAVRHQPRARIGLRSHGSEASALSVRPRESGDPAFSELRQRNKSLRIYMPDTTLFGITNRDPEASEPRSR